MSIQRDASARKTILHILSESVTEGAPQLARILTLGETQIDELLTIGPQILPALGSEDGSLLARQLLARAFVEADPQDTRILELLAYPNLGMQPQQLIQMAIPNSATGRRVGQNLLLLAEMPARGRQGIVEHVDDLSTRLINRGRENLGEQAYNAWSQLITDAGDIDPSVQLKAAIPTLAFALRQTNAPLSALIVTTFPVVYAQLLQSAGDEGFNSLSALLSPLSFFVDFDRAKSARNELVDAFFNSSWPPSDLLLTALNADIDQKVLKRLDQKYRGHEYLAAIIRDTRRLAPQDRARVKASVSRFR